jgi:hypothetical protein
MFKNRLRTRCPSYAETGDDAIVGVDEDQVGLERPLAYAAREPALDAALLWVGATW